MVPAMTCTQPTPQPSTTLPPITEPVPSRHRHRAVSEFEALFTETGRWRNVVVWRYARWLDDAHETASLAVWEAIVNGERDHRALYAAARRALMRLRRYEDRHRRPLPPDEQLGEDPADRVAEVVDAERLVAAVGAPTAAVREWIDRKASASAGGRLSSRTKSAGQRWAAHAREQIGAADAAA